MKKIPAIISDIDGVLLRGKDPIKGAAQAVKFLRQPLQKLMPNLPILNKNQTLPNIRQKLFSNNIEKNQQLPFVCLTNGGGMLEQKKAEQINQYLGLNQNLNLNFNTNQDIQGNSNEFIYQKFEKEDIILNYTPLRGVLQEQYRNKTVLLVGIGDVKEIAQSMGIKKYITIEEYASLYPELLKNFSRPRLNKFTTRQEIQKRFALRNQYPLYYPLQINAIAVINDPIYWEDSIQIMCDLCSSEDGKVLQRQIQHQKQHIPIFTVNNDLTFSAKFHIERFAFGPFTNLFRTVFEMIYNYQPTIHEYGKPTKNTYDFTGDNPKSDIRGANQKDWVSILVRSGIFQGDNDPHDPAKVVVDNFFQAVEYICEQEKISTKGLYQNNDNF
ncbi:HAD-like domain [Pseudocohnilembus persalinus]|uniref:HAD-like domain n=1 Tax=Pseudocohnilembus persalinus TaxID=266149 RepID=A0A0V0QC52_PSEPJ|nr:HAD-like domain [Pseudocohnilembus persalinus]|eukprot:KRW99821.1 HAD-like domain [Pseudocohnilembus persalinus]